MIVYALVLRYGFYHNVCEITRQAIQGCSIFRNSVLLITRAAHPFCRKRALPALELCVRPQPFHLQALIAMHERLPETAYPLSSGCRTTKHRHTETGYNFQMGIYLHK